MNDDDDDDDDDAQLFMENPSQSYEASLAIWDHTVLPANRHKWTHSAITPAKQAITIYLSRMEGWVDLGSWIAARPGIEPTTAWSQVRRPKRYATSKRPKYINLVRLRAAWFFTFNFALDELAE